MVRRRLGELGLAFHVVTIPRPSSQRQEVLAVSGQPTVPVLVTEDGVFTDENDILAYLEKTYGSPPRRPQAKAQLWPDDVSAHLDLLAERLEKTSEELAAISRAASSRKAVDLTNVLQVAAQAAADAAHWTAGRAESLRS